MIRFLCFFIFAIICCQGCTLAGQEIGYCSNNPLSSKHFCTQEVDTYICLPAHNVFCCRYEVTWSEYDAFYKDRQIQNLVLTHLQEQIISEYLNGGALQISNNPGCYEAYKRFSCRWNFPTCSKKTNTSLKMCQSVCNTFLNACGGSADVCSIIYAKTDLGLDSNC